MSKIYFATLLLLGISQFSSGQTTPKDTLSVWPDQYVLDLLNNNDSLKIVFDDVSESLSDARLESIFADSKDLSVSELIEKLNVAKALSEVLGDNASWSFDDSVETSFNFENIEEFTEFFERFTAQQSITFEDDGSLKREEITYRSGKTEVTEKDEKGQYIKTITDVNGVETKEIITDTSAYFSKSTTSKKKNE